ncbi:hypothetical protein [Citrobacter sp. S-77]|uniref:hypothetical protein n=1 Tax=Citrobacter sp. S-77 TaxID=1080067 RepID=UPI0005F02E34|nr:hypothetical protein [Citrobacter sp. S-77]
MIYKITSYEFYNQLTLEINNASALTKESWDSIISIREKIVPILYQHQKCSQMKDLEVTRCGYCGLPVGGTGRGEIEHIALKSKFPQFSFYSKNLIVVCSNCNGSSRKGRKFKHIMKVNGKFENHIQYDCMSEQYTKFDFLFIHPKIDDPAIEIIWNGSIPVKEASSEKGKFHIKLFELDTLIMVMEREKDLNQIERYKKDPESFKKMIEACRF